MKATRIGIMVCVVASLYVLLPSIGMAQEAPANPALENVLEVLGNLSPAGNINIQMGTEKEQYTFGESVDIRFLTDRSCYAVMMHIFHKHNTITTPEYELTDIQFFIPSGFVPDNKLEAGRIYSTQLDFQLPIEAAQPAGISTINLFCSSQPFNLFSPNFETESVYSIAPDNQERLQDLSKQLAQLEQLQWNGGSVSIAIIPSGARGQTAPAPPPGALPPIITAGTTGKTENSLFDDSATTP